MELSGIGIDKMELTPCLIYISAALTACSSAKVIGVWFGILPLISLSFSLMKQAQAVVPLAWELASV